MPTPNRAGAAFRSGIVWAVGAAGVTALVASALTSQPTTTPDGTGGVVRLKTAGHPEPLIPVACAAVGIAAGAAGALWRDTRLD